MVLTKFVRPLLAILVPQLIVVVAAAALDIVRVAPAPPVMERASNVNPVPVTFRLALLVMKMVFVPMPAPDPLVVWSVPVKVLFAPEVQVYPVVNQLIPATVNEPLSFTVPAVPLKL